MATASDPPLDPRVANQIRFEEDLEFLMSLANPYCVHELALKGLLSTPTMLNYLSYLKYFHQPAYARFVRYPLSLAVLDLLTSSPTFRDEMAKPEVAHLWGRRLLAGWTYAGGRRLGGDNEGPAAASGGAGPVGPGHGMPKTNGTPAGAGAEDMDVD